MKLSDLIKQSSMLHVLSCPVVKLNILRQEGKVQDPQKVLKNEEICTFCEEYATEALECLANNDTQTEVIEMLHMTCSKVPPFKKEVIT